MRWRRKKRQLSGEETHRIISGNHRKPNAKKAHQKAEWKQRNKRKTPQKTNQKERKKNQPSRNALKTNNNACGIEVIQIKKKAATTTRLKTANIEKFYALFEFSTTTQWRLTNSCNVQCAQMQLCTMFAEQNNKRTPLHISHLHMPNAQMERTLTVIHMHIYTAIEFYMTRWTKDMWYKIINNNKLVCSTQFEMRQYVPLNIG